MTGRYRSGLCYQARGEFMSFGIEDTETGAIYAMGDQETIDEVVACLNDGMPNPLIAGIGLTFKTFEEATEV